MYNYTDGGVPKAVDSAIDLKVGRGCGGVMLDGYPKI